MGISFAYIPTLQAIGAEFDIATILGAEIVGGIVAIIFGIFVKWIRPLFPPLVTGTVIFTIGLSLYPTAVKYMAGGAGTEWFGNVKSWVVALVTLAVVVILSNFTKGMVAGRGFTAFTAYTFGGATPIGSALASLLFGFAESLGIRIELLGLDIPASIVDMFPYALALVALAYSSWRRGRRMSGGLNASRKKVKAKA